MCENRTPPRNNTRAQREDDEWREEGKILFVVAVSAAFVAPARRASARVCSLSCHAPSLQMQQQKQDDRFDALQGFLDHSDVAYHMDVDAEQVHSSLLAWYAQNRRRLPWRGDPPPYNGSTAGFAAAAARPSPAPPPATEKVSAYGVWVSEIMCQQTRVEAVIPYWLAWMEAFPTVHALAAASEDEVNAKWAGLGFYRRARMLHEAAKQVVREFGGELPTSVEELKRIKGIGPYTAGAIASIVGGIPAPIVDGNVLRVASRLCGIAANPKEGAFSGDGKLAWAIAEKLVEAGGGAQPGEFNQALMELGATYCAPSGTGVDPADPLAPHYRSVRIGRDAYHAHKRGVLGSILDRAAASPSTGLHTCPVCAKGAAAFIEGLRTVCDAPPSQSLPAAGGASLTGAAAAAARTHALLPLPVPKKARREERLAIAALYRTTTTAAAGRSWLLVKRPEGGLLAGQWELPSCLISSDPEERPEAPDERTVREACDRALECARVAGGDGEAAELLNAATQRSALPDALEHIFSHVRHTMHVEYGDCGEGGGADAVSCWTSDEGRAYEWMTEERMAEVGVTAGVLKVVGAVKGAAKGAAPSARGKAGKDGAARSKRKAPDEETAQQPKLSAFFKKKPSEQKE